MTNREIVMEQVKTLAEINAMLSAVFAASQSNATELSEQIRHNAESITMMVQVAGAVSN
jgi:hypothetical protein